MFEWITSTIRNLGYLGVAFLAFLENLFPPIPSELVIPLAGFVAAQGALSIWGVIATAALGSLAGALLCTRRDAGLASVVCGSGSNGTAGG